MSEIAKALNFKEAWGVYMLFIMIAGAGAVTPALAAFGAAFPDADPVTLSLIQSLPSLTTMLGTLLMGFIAGKNLSFKTCGIIALASYAVFGCMPAIFNDSLTVILVARALVGFSMGMVSPLGASVFLRLVKDSEERAKYLGRGGAFQQIGCVVLTLAGGFLCGIDWRLTFWAYLLALVGLVFFVICFKEPEPVAQPEKEDADKPKEKSHIGAFAWFAIAIMFIGGMNFSPTMMNFATLMATKCAGYDAVTVSSVAGVLLSIFVLGGVVSSFLLDKIMKVAGKFTGMLALLIVAVGDVIIATATSVPMFTVGIIIFGIGWCMVIPIVNFEVGGNVNLAGVAIATSFVMFAMHVSNFVGSYYMGFIFSLVGTDPTTCLMVCTGVFVALAVLWGVVNLKNPAYKK